MNANLDTMPDYSWMFLSKFQVRGVFIGIIRLRL